MSTNPLLNALGASGYIVLVAAVFTFISQTQRNQSDTFLSPIIFMSLLTLSAAVMAFLFFYQPVQLLISGKKQQALDVCVKTIAIFAGLTLLALILLLVGVGR